MSPYLPQLLRTLSQYANSLSTQERLTNLADLRAVIKSAELMLIRTRIVDDEPLDDDDL